MAGGLGRGEDLGGPEPRRPRLRPGQAEGLRPGHAALPLRRAARRPPQGLFGRRRDRPLPAPQRLRRPAADGLRLLRPARREPRDPHRRAPARLHRALDHQLPPAVPRLGHLDRLEPRALHPLARVLPLDPVDLPAPLRGRPRLPDRGRRAVVSQGPDRARQRAGDRRPLRALRDRGRAEEARAVVLPDHRLRRSPARRLRSPRVLARARRDDAAQLDRPLRGRRGSLPVRGAGDRLPRLHDPARHALRRHLLRPRSRAPRSRPPDRGHGERRRRSATTSPPRSANRPASAGTTNARRPASGSAAPSSTPSTASGSRCSSPTTC